MKDLETDYKLIPMGEISDEARELAVRWATILGFDWIEDKHKLASDIMNYARRHHDQELKKLKRSVSAEGN